MRKWNSCPPGTVRLATALRRCLGEAVDLIDKCKLTQGILFSSQVENLSFFLFILADQSASYLPRV